MYLKMDTMKAVQRKFCPVLKLALFVLPSLVVLPAFRAILSKMGFVKRRLFLVHLSSFSLWGEFSFARLFFCAIFVVGRKKNKKKKEQSQE